MLRLKFVPYALVALALALGHVFLLSPAVSERAEALALEEARAAAGAARAEALRVRADLLATGLSLRTLPELQGILAASPARGVAVATPAERLDLLQGLARSVLSRGGGLAPELRGRLVLGLVSDEGSALVRGSGSPGAAPKGVDVRALSAAGTQGLVGRAYDAPHLFVSFPLVPAGGTLLLGLPLTGEALAQVAPAGGALGVALLSGGEPVAVSGPVAAAELKGLLAKLKAGGAQVVRRGAASVLGPLELPLAAGEGGAPLVAAARAEVLPGLEGVGLVSLEPSMRALANYQRLSLVAFLGLLALTVVWLLLLLGGGTEVVEAAPGMELGEQGGEPGMGGVFGTLPPQPFGEGLGEAAPLDAYGSGAQSPLDAYGSGALAAPPAPAEALATGTSDSSASRAPWTTSRPMVVDDPRVTSRPMEDPRVTSRPHDPRVISRPMAAVEDPRVTSRPMSLEDSGSFRRGLAVSMDTGSHARSGISGPMVPPPAPAPAYAYEENSDATRVATVPEELLRSTAAHPPAAPAAPPPLRTPLADPDEAHFQETFQEFMATRERCGEPADNLTYERFAAKLRKNREQLTQKYACRTVRFQVYVKEGKAALKATPVKD